MELKEYIKKLPFYDKMTEEDVDTALSGASIVKYASGSMLQSCEGSCLGMYYVLKGSIRALMISDEGREITLFHLNAGDTCILSASCVLHQISFETQMIATSDIEILLVNSYTYEKLMESNINIRCFTYELAMERFSTAVWVLQQIIFNRFDRRLAGYFVSSYDSTGNAVLNMTQESIAKEVNTAREVVARMIKQFSNDGWIEVKRGSIILKDVGALRNIM